MRKNIPGNVKCGRLLSAVLALVLLCAPGAGSASADSPEARLIESRVNDWSYDAYHQIVTHQYDESGKRVKSRYATYGDEQFTEKWYESEVGYDYYDNGELRMRFDSGSETHYDRFGTRIDSPVAAVPNWAYCVFFDAGIEHFYDLQGNLIRLEARSEDYDDDPRTFDVTVYEYRYDDRGRILETRSDGQTDFCLTFTYAQDGGYTGRATANYDPEMDSYEERYDSSGRILSRMEKNGYVDSETWESSDSETVHEYAPDGSRETISVYTGEGSGRTLRRREELRSTFNSQGQVQRTEQWDMTDADEQLQERTEYEYDGNGNMVHKQVFRYYDSYSPPTLVRDEKNSYQ